MTRLPSLALALAALITTSPAAHAAEKQLWACQYTASAGLRWENGRWKTTTFKLHQPFVLVVDNGMLEAGSAGKAMNRMSYPVCTIEESSTMGREFYCVDHKGTHLAFSPSRGQGGISNIWGMMDNDPKQRDTVSVDHFTCQKY